MKTYAYGSVCTCKREAPNHHLLFKSTYVIVRIMFLRYRFMLCCVTLLSGCTSLSYYSQSIGGHMDVIRKTQDINTVINQSGTPAATRQKLELSLELLEFAEHTLLLPNNGSYRAYADLGRPYVLWNVFATPELSLQAKSWCYIFVGCLSYRGYFAKQDALDLATQLQQQGFDVHVGGVAAYSTLGWFKDPLLNTMFQHDDLYLARIIFHELAHQKLYVKDDPEFNEAFADSIAIIGLDRWLEEKAYQQRYQSLLDEQEYERQFVQLLLSYKQQLQNVYESTDGDEYKRQEKQRLLAKLETDYIALSKSWNGYRGFDTWFDRPVNNARLSAVSTYRELVPVFLQHYDTLQQDLDAFYQHINRLQDCTKTQRLKLLHSNINNWRCD